MKCKRKGPSGKRGQTRLTFISAAVLVAVLAGLYLGLAWSRYQRVEKAGAIKLAQTASALLNVEYIQALHENAQETRLVEDTLVRLVEAKDSIYYAYLLLQRDGEILVAADSSAARTGEPVPSKESCVQVAQIDSAPLETGECIVIKQPCGTWIHTLVPVWDDDHKDIVAALGMSFYAAQWRANLWRMMIPDILVTVCVAALVLTVFDLLHKRQRVRLAEESRRESERSKNVFFSHLPGLAYRCKNDYPWTIEFVSESCLELTGYSAQELVSGTVTFNDIIAPEYRERLHKIWPEVLLDRKQFRAEYEIITKSGERKWVLEYGQGVYDARGEVEALEGILLDISKSKNKDLQITHLREHDFLTGLYNREYMDRERQRLDRPEFWPLSIVICDIDGLRVINNAYGYEEGNKLICTTAQLLQSCLRDGFVLAHMGGGEFTFLLPNTDGHATELFIMDIEDVIQRYNRTTAQTHYALSVSFGYSTKYSEVQEMQMVLKEADDYLHRRKMLHQNSSHSDIVSSIMATLYAKSQETEEHGRRLGALCMMIGRELQLSQNDLDDLQLLSKLHDIGKIGIEDRILNKPGKLNEAEWKIMKQHPRIGYRIAMTTPQLKHIAQYILYHHERWDGTGYPLGLKGEEIPLISRILAVADVFDAMTEDRVYRKALSETVALKEIARGAGTQFDPEIARLFVRILKEKRGICLHAQEQPEQARREAQG